MRNKRGDEKMKRKQLKWLGILLGAAMLFASFGATAQNRGGGGVIRLEETVIEGRVQKPNAFFINTRQALVYEGMALKESFVSEITKSVENGGL